MNPFRSAARLRQVLALAVGSASLIVGGPASAADEQRALARAAARTTISDAGLVGRAGVWAMNGIGLWISADGGRSTL